MKTAICGEKSAVHQAGIMDVSAPSKQLVHASKGRDVMFFGTRETGAIGTTEARSGGRIAAAVPLAGQAIDRDADELWAQRGYEHVRLRVADIEWAESERDYAHVHNGTRSFLLRTTLTALHARLGTESYMRIRRSALVRVDRIASIRDRGCGDIRILLRSGTELRVGRTYLKPIRARLRRWMVPGMIPALAQDVPPDDIIRQPALDHRTAIAAEAGPAR